MSGSLDLGALVRPFQPSALQNLSQAFSNFPQQQEQSQLDKLAVQSAQQQLKAGQQASESNDFQLQQAKQQAAQQYWQFAGQQLMNNPQMAINPSPALRQRLQNTGDQLGVQPFDESGNVNVDLWKQSWNALPPEQQAQYWAMDPKMRAASSKNLKDLPENFYTQPRQLDPKTQAQIDEFEAHVGVYQSQAGVNETAAMRNAASAANDRALAAKNTVGAQLEGQRVQSEIAKNVASANSSYANAAARITEANAAMMRATSSNAATGAAQAATLYKGALDSFNKAGAAMTGAANAQKAMEKATGMTIAQMIQSDNSNIAKRAIGLVQTFNNAQAMKERIQPQLNALQGALQGNATYANALRSLTGKTVTVEDAGGAKKTASGGYAIGQKYGGMTYLGGDPYDPSSWKQ